ncbi:efflux RND transporter periplasmic adaptor subunit [Pseudomonas sp. PL-6]
MSPLPIQALGLVVLIAVGAASGYWLGRQEHGHAPVAADSERPVLYWYDPMYPQQRFEQPGKSPFMDMDLVPRYADTQVGDAPSTAMQIDPRLTQNLGMRLAPVVRGPLQGELEVVGSLGFDQRDVALVQTRSSAFVERVYPLAPEDLLAAGAPLVDLLVPDWLAAQEEYLALRDLDQPQLLAAARQRLQLVGMPAALIARLERSGQVQRLWTVTSPIAGVVQELEVREGMTLSAGQSLARINGLQRVWLEVALPEAQASGIEPGQPVEVLLPALPGESIGGRIEALLPEANLDSRTLRLRVVLDNPAGRLRPGMSARVRLQHSQGSETLLVPSEAVIRSGRRNLVLLAEGEGRYRPLEIRIGREQGDQVEVLEGLSEGQQVVASGQFLLDSEASLRGLLAQELGQPAAEVKLQPALHEAEGQIDEIEADGLLLTHGPFKTLGMPGMSMFFPVVDSALLQGLQPGQRVRVAVRESDEGLLIERIQPLASAEHGDHGHDEVQP